ncbi:MAG: glycosyltransferase family A protein [Lachnospiraceae bacterium]|nr:glycosyltransferase family A protein [Lachnospiraceae bacterium]
MKKLDVLLSILKMDDLNYIDSLKITGNAVVINQCDSDSEENISRRSVNGSDQAVKYVKTTTRGLSRSRNLAISESDADICILCDNDVVYVDDYEKLILEEFEKRPDADIIVFYIKRKEKPVPNYATARKMDYLSVLKIFSPEIAFRRESVKDLKFNEDFGAGSGKYIMGEENIFLYDALKKKKNIYYVPTKIAELKEVQSTWFSEYDEKFFISRGANYAAMSKGWSHLLIWQFALRKKNLYKENITMIQALKAMYKGRREFCTYE